VDLIEVAPPGWGHTKAEKEKTKPWKPKSKIGGTAAAFKRALDDGRFKGLPGSKTKKEKTADMFKLMWSMKKKGDKPHYKPGTDKKYKKYQEEETSCDSSYEKLKKKIGSKKMHKEPVVVEGISTSDTKRLEKATVLSFSNDPKSVDRARARQVEVDYKDLMKQQKAKKKKSVKEEKIEERVGEVIKKGVKRHKDAVEKKKIKNRKAVPYAALAAEHQPEGDIVLERDFTIGAKEREKFHTFYKKSRAAKAKKEADSTRSDSRRYGVKFADAKGTGRIRGGKKVYD